MKKHCEASNTEQCFINAIWSVLLTKEKLRFKLLYTVQVKNVQTLQAKYDRFHGQQENNLIGFLKSPHLP